jgi:hypothetical protein
VGAVAVVTPKRAVKMVPVVVVAPQTRRIANLIARHPPLISEADYWPKKGKGPPHRGASLNRASLRRVHVKKGWDG